MKSRRLVLQLETPPAVPIDDWNTMNLVSQKRSQRGFSLTSDNFLISYIERKQVDIKSANGWLAIKLQP